MTKRRLFAALVLLAGFAVVDPARAADGALASPDAARTILMTSVAIPTVEGRGKVPELAAYYASVLKDAGFADADIEITPMGETATFAATLRGRERGKPILLIGHMDVVAADPADWERPPFTPVEEDGYIFGRGVSDNKFDVAILVATLARLKREGYRPRRDVILVLSGDEETTQATTRALAEKYKDAELVLNGDGGGGVMSEDGKPAYYNLQAGEKTYADYRIEFTNPGGHSSRPSPINAITQLSNALSKVGAYSFKPQSGELTRASMSGMAPRVDPAIGAAMRAFVADPNDAAALATLRADPEYVGQVGTTCVATMISGGHAPNALPQRATANINCRIYPGVTVEAVRAELTRVIDDPAATVTVVQAGVGSDASPLRTDVLKAVTDSVHKAYPGLAVIPGMAAYATDGAFYRAVGIPSYGTSGLFIRPSDDFTHGLNERVTAAAIPVALVYWDNLIRTLTR